MPVDDGCPETPQCAALRICAPNFVSKPPFVVHEVMETTVRQLRELQKAQVFRDQRQNGFVGELMVVWRAVDQDGDVLDILVQSRRDKKAAKKFFRKLLK